MASFDKEPTFKSNLLVYEGRYYLIGEGICATQNFLCLWRQVFRYLDVALDCARRDAHLLGGILRERFFFARQFVARRFIVAGMTRQVARNRGRVQRFVYFPGRREAMPEDIQRLSESVAEVGMMNPITVDADYTLVAGLHRLEAAKRLGWTEVECTVCGLDRLHAELAEIDENVIRTGLSDLELSELLARRKKIYETLHPVIVPFVNCFAASICCFGSRRESL